MSHFGWRNWSRLHANQIAGLLPHGREREVLKFLHRRSSVGILARRISRALPGTAVKVESIWVDGTPQATFIDAGGGSANCELADLLLIVRRENASGGLQDEHAMLIQAKITPRHNRLTSGSSTKLERRLLERLDRTQQLELHRDTGRTSLLGTFTLGPTADGVGTGMADCARYLLAPKCAGWLYHARATPFQVGWPATYTKPFLRKPTGFLNTILELGLWGRNGRLVGVPGSDPWSNLVSTIRGTYAGVHMAKYRQDRIHIGSGFVAFQLLPRLFNRQAYGLHVRPADQKPPPETSTEQDAGRASPPAIPMLIITLRDLSVIND